MSYAQRRAIRTRATRMEGRRVNVRTDLLAQVEASRHELLSVAVDLAHRLRSVSIVEAEEAALEVNGTRRGLGESSLLESRVTAEVLVLVEDALRGRSPE